MVVGVDSLSWSGAVVLGGDGEVTGGAGVWGSAEGRSASSSARRCAARGGERRRKKKKREKEKKKKKKGKRKMEREEERELSAGFAAAVDARARRLQSEATRTRNEEKGNTRTGIEFGCRIGGSSEKDFGEIRNSDGKRFSSTTKMVLKIIFSE